VSINNGTVTTHSADDGVNASLDDGLTDQNATPSITINGGTVVGIGSGGMPQTPTVGQGWIQQNVTVKARDWVKVTDSNDAEVVSLTAEQAATSLFVSTPQVMEGQTYKVTSGSVTVEVVAGENAQGGFGGPGSGGSSDLGVVPPENGGLRAPALTGNSRRGETNQPTGGSSS
jgi:putative lipoprotein